MLVHYYMEKITWETLSQAESVLLHSDTREGIRGKANSNFSFDQLIQLPLLFYSKVCIVLISNSNQKHLSLPFAFPGYSKHCPR